MSFESLPIFQHTKYTIREKLVSWGNVYEIFDEKNKKLGSINVKHLTIGTRYTIKSKDEGDIGKIEKKIISLTPTYTIKDEKGKKVGVISKKLIKFGFGEEYVIRDKKNKKIAECDGNFLNRTYDIKAKRKKVAKIHKKYVSVADSYNVDIIDDSAPTYLIVPAVVVIDNEEHEEKKED